MTDRYLIDPDTGQTWPWNDPDRPRAATEVPGLRPSLWRIAADRAERCTLPAQAGTIDATAQVMDTAPARTVATRTFDAIDCTYAALGRRVAAGRPLPWPRTLAALDRALADLEQAAATLRDGAE